MGQVGAILAKLQLDRVRLLMLRREVPGLQLPLQKVRSVGPKFLLVGFRVQSLSGLATERDNL